LRVTALRQHFFQQCINFFQALGLLFGVLEIFAVLKLWLKFCINFFTTLALFKSFCDAFFYICNANLNLNWIVVFVTCIKCFNEMVLGFFIACLFRIALLQHVSNPLIHF
jgi:flagellar biosynthesis protein FlhB